MAAEDGIDAVVPGCTELPMLFRGIALPVPRVDVMRVHMDALVRLVTEEQPLPAASRAGQA